MLYAHSHSRVGHKFAFPAPWSGNAGGSLIRGFWSHSTILRAARKGLSPSAGYSQSRFRKSSSYCLLSSPAVLLPRVTPSEHEEGKITHLTISDKRPMDPIPHHVHNPRVDLMQPPRVDGQELVLDRSNLCPSVPFPLQRQQPRRPGNRSAKRADSRKAGNTAPSRSVALRWRYSGRRRATSCR
jgi:hypothetical protein